MPCLNPIISPPDVFLIQALQIGQVITQMQSRICQKEQPRPPLFPNILSALTDRQPFHNWATATGNPITVTLGQPVGKHPFLLLFNFLLISLSYSLPFFQTIPGSGCFKPFRSETTVELQRNHGRVRSATTTKHRLKGQSQPAPWLSTPYAKLLCEGREGSFSPFLTATVREPYKERDYCSNILHRSSWCTAGQLRPCNSRQAGDNIASIISLKSIWCRAAHATR